MIDSNETPDTDSTDEVEGHGACSGRVTSSHLVADDTEGHAFRRSVVADDSGDETDTEGHVIRGKG